MLQWRLAVDGCVVEASLRARQGGWQSVIRYYRARTPKVDFPLKIVRVDDRSFGMGAEWRDVQGARAWVYSPAKTVADLFKFRNKVGMERALEALKDGLRRRLFTVDELLKCAKVDRVLRIIVPYIEGYFG